MEASEPGRNSAHDKLRKAFRRVAFEGIKSIKGKEIIIIMTQCLATTPNDLESFQEHAAIARARGVPFVNINITYDEDTNKARLCSNDRKEGCDSGKTKLTHPAVLSQLRHDFTLIDPTSLDTGVKDLCIRHFEIDTTGLSIGEAMERVFSSLLEIPGSSSP